MNPKLGHWFGSLYNKFQLNQFRLVNNLREIIRVKILRIDCIYYFSSNCNLRWTHWQMFLRLVRADRTKNPSKICIKNVNKARGELLSSVKWRRCSRYGGRFSWSKAPLAVGDKQYMNCQFQSNPRGRKGVFSLLFLFVLQWKSGLSCKNFTPGHFTNYS